MPKLRIYLDTSVISHLYHDDAPQRKADTEEFFENAVAPKAYETFISQAVIDELLRTKDLALRQQFLDAVSRYELVLLPEGGEDVARLASACVEQNIIPTKKPEDTLHVA